MAHKGQVIYGYVACELVKLYVNTYLLEKTSNLSTYFKPLPSSQK